MFYVYILQSLAIKEKTYIGYTLDLNRRFKEHNNGGSKYTAQYCPWKLISYIAFESKDKAIAFEKYLKTHSGKAFLQKRFLELYF